jgi:ABC-type uncharacterized transport system auxiliary subunit
MKRRVIVAAPVVLAGCASLLPKQQYIPQVNWPLDPQPPASEPVNAAGKVVLLRDLNAGPGMSNQGIQTLHQDGSLSISYYNQWAVAPADAAAEVLANWLAASGAFSAVVAPGSRLTANLIVEGEFSELLSDLGAGDAKAVLTLVVIQSVNGNTRPLAQQRIVGTAKLSGTDYPAQVAAQTAALADAMQQAVRLITRFR